MTSYKIIYISFCIHIVLEGESHNLFAGGIRLQRGAGIVLHGVVLDDKGLLVMSDVSCHCYEQSFWPGSLVWGENSAVL